MLQNAHLLAKIGADRAENERNLAEILPKTGNYPTTLRVAPSRPTAAWEAGIHKCECDIVATREKETSPNQGLRVLIFSVSFGKTFELLLFFNTSFTFIKTFCGKIHWPPAMIWHLPKFRQFFRLQTQKSVNLSARSKGYYSSDNSD